MTLSSFRLDEVSYFTMKKRRRHTFKPRELRKNEGRSGRYDVNM
jgi:hypothetical protein